MRRMFKAFSNLFLTPNRKDQLEATQTPLPSDGDDEFDDPPPVMKLADVRHQATANLKRAIMDYNDHEKQSLQIRPINDVIEGLQKASTTLTKQVSRCGHSCDGGDSWWCFCLLVCVCVVGDRGEHQDHPCPCDGLEG